MSEIGHDGQFLPRCSWPPHAIGAVPVRWPLTPRERSTVPPMHAEAVSDVTGAAWRFVLTFDLPTYHELTARAERQYEARGE